jgi:phosphoribosylanthranilate isomerase
MERIEVRPGTVKICGIREPDHAIAAAEAGADMIGYNFASTRRYVAPEIARSAIEAAREASAGGVLAVGVFVNSTVAEMNAVVDVAGIDVVQLSGDEDPDVVAGIKRPVIKALRPVPGSSSDELLQEFVRWNSSFPPIAFLVDGHLPGHFGGTGARADWELAARVAGIQPVMLAGGLSPANVAEAIGAVGPLGVDVSSGVEIDGRKDTAAIQAFIRQAKDAFKRRPAPR